MAEKVITESARDLNVVAEYDLVVIGGGIAGVAAAAAAAREGVSVCLLEKENGLGGLATLGNVAIWLPICDGMGRQVIGGIGEELLRLAVRDLGRNNLRACFNGVPPCWEPGGDEERRKRTRFRVSFNPSAYLLALEDWVIGAGVDIWYDTRLSRVRKEGRYLTYAIVENKSGRMAIAGRTFIDASGDGDLCAMAGEATESLDSNVSCGWFYYLVDGQLYLKPCSNSYSSELTKEDNGGPYFRGDDGKQVTAMLLASHERMREELVRLRQLHAGSEVQIFGLPSIPCFRATRRFVGSFSLDREHVYQSFPDKIGMTGDWRQCGPVYSVPLRSLVGVSNRNLAVVGRCISVATNLWDCTRAIPTCAMTGQAAGTAAALAGRRGDGGDIAGIDIGTLQQRLRERGVILD